MKQIFFALSFLLLPTVAVAQTQVVSLSSAEKSYYALAFSYAMETQPTGKSYDWKTYSSGGTIAPEDAFISRSGSTCRQFTESYNVQGVEGTHEGVGCKRKGAEGWCRLGMKQALTCAMEKRNSFDIDIPVVALKAPDINLNLGTAGVGKTGSATPSTPHVNPNIEGNTPSQVPTAEGVADAVTGAAGSVAGPATSGTLKWFQSTFR